MAYPCVKLHASRSKLGRLSSAVAAVILLSPVAPMVMGFSARSGHIVLRSGSQHQELCHQKGAASSCVPVPLLRAWKGIVTGAASRMWRPRSSLHALKASHSSVIGKMPR